MKKYKVQWVMSKIEGAIGLTVEAKNCRDAFNIVVREHENSSHPYIYVYSGWGLFDHKEYSNPHYVQPQTAKPQVDDEARTQQPAPTDGRVARSGGSTDGSDGWFEKIDGSSLTEKQILLAQLSELRMIKRCVVGTVVIVVIIPFVMVAILAT